MRGLALTLCRVFALLACFVCASGYATPAGAQPLPYASGAQQEDFCRAADQGGDPAADFESGSPGSDFAEHDDDDDGNEEPTGLPVGARPEPDPWESDRPQRAFTRAPLISGHRTLEPRPPRAL